MGVAQLAVAMEVRQRGNEGVRLQVVRGNSQVRSSK